MTDPTPEQLREWADSFCGEFMGEEAMYLLDAFLRAEADRREKGGK